jgi:hypothetical protein
MSIALAKFISSELQAKQMMDGTMGFWTKLGYTRESGEERFWRFERRIRTS